MNQLAIITALSYGFTVCFKTSRYEVQQAAGKLLAVNLYDSSIEELNHVTAQQCFIKTGGV